MANRQLTPEELEQANALLDDIRSKLVALSAGEKDLLFAYRRKIFKELTYDERSKPMVRRKLKRSGPTRLDSSGGIYKCNPGGLRVIHGGARVAHATHTSARRGG